MEAKRFIKLVHMLCTPQVIYITFSPDAEGIKGLRCLNALIVSNNFVLITQSLVQMLAVIETGEWQNVSRTVAVYGMAYADDDPLVAIARGVEKVEVSDHGAKGLFTSRESSFVEAAASITNAVMDKNLYDTVEGWGLRLYSDPRMAMDRNGGLPGISFIVRDGDSDVILTVSLDGWSGRMAVNDGEWSDVVYTQAFQLQVRIREALTQYLDYATRLGS